MKIFKKNFSTLKKKNVILTGGSRGIGFEIASEFWKKGNYNVALIGRSKERNEAAIKKIKEENKDNERMKENLLFGVECQDISKQENCKRIVEECEENWGKDQIDILVNCAGVSYDALLPRLKESECQEMLNTNLMGVVNLSGQVSKSMLKYSRKIISNNEKPNLNIITIGSVVGRMGNEGQSVYAATKSALYGFTKSIAKELGPRGIRCNLISPGFIETEMTINFDEEKKKKLYSQICLRRFGTPFEIAQTVLFLCDATYISGQEIIVDGGLS